MMVLKKRKMSRSYLFPESNTTDLRINPFLTILDPLQLIHFHSFIYFRFVELHFPMLGFSPRLLKHYRLDNWFVFSGVYIFSKICLSSNHFYHTRLRSGQKPGVWDGLEPLLWPLQRMSKAIHHCKVLFDLFVSC